MLIFLDTLSHNIFLAGKEKAEKEKLEKEMAIDRAIETNDIYVTPSPTHGANATWADMKELEVIFRKHNCVPIYSIEINI